MKRMILGACITMQIPVTASTRAYMLRLVGGVAEELKVIPVRWPEPVVGVSVDLVEVVSQTNFTEKLKMSQDGLQDSD